MRKLKFENVGLSAGTSIKIGRYRQEDQCNFMGWHIHPEYEVVYVRNGSGILHIDTKKVPYSEGTLLFIGPGIAHTDFGNNEHRDGLEVVVQFTETFVREKLAAFPEFAPVLRLAERSRRALIFRPAIRQRVSHRLESLDPRTPAVSLLTFLECLLVMSPVSAYTELFPDPELPSVEKPADTDRLAYIFDRVNQDFAGELTSGKLAAELGMTTNSFCRFFRVHTSQTFTDFLNNYRLERAQDLLGEGTMDVQSVMYACGFRSAPYFSRQFRRRVGISPSEYRSKRIYSDINV